MIHFLKIIFISFLGLLVWAGLSFAQQVQKQRIVLQANLNVDGPALKEGVEWRIFKPEPKANGDLDELSYAFGGTKAFNMTPGEYLIHAAYGHAAAVKKITVGTEPATETFTLNAGGLKLLAIASENAPIPSRLLRFDVYAAGSGESDQRKLLARDLKAGEIIPFPVGTYHVVSRFGNLNASVRADLRVQPGKLTEATLQHRAAIITFRLVRTKGGDAIADTAWSILTEVGEVIEESASTFPTMVLSEGNYTAIARHNEAIYSQDFQVRSGYNKDVEVQALN